MLQTNSNVLQRYLFFTDVHLGHHFRAFGQPGSSLQNFRKGGPNVLEVDLLCVHQVFVDALPPLPGSRSLTLQIGR